MSRIFLSHSSKDLFEAIAVRDWLAVEGWDDVFLDADPERGINPGERWEQALHQAAQRCEAVIFLLSRNWLASGWCRREYELARSLNKQLFAVVIDREVEIETALPELAGTWQVGSLLAGADGRVFPVTLPSSHEVRHVTFGADGLRRLKRGLEKAGLDAKFFAWPPEGEPARPPYRGLKPLEAADAGIFFGRDAPIIEGIDTMRALAAAAAPRILVILGASGAGKSSFLRAGLLPRLARDDAHFLPLPPIRPERAALTGEHGFLHALETVLPGRSRDEWRRLAAEGAGAIRPLLADLVHAIYRRTLADGEARKRPAILIAIDQAEELFRPAGAEEGAALLAILRDLTIGEDPSVIVVFAIRSDAYDALEHAKPLEGLRQVPLALLPMPRGAYNDVIEGPARRFAETGGRKLAIEPQLTARLLKDIEAGGGSDALPLLAFTLEQLFLEYGGAGALRLADYEAFGGLRGAIDAAVARAFTRADADARIPRDRAERERLLRRGLVPWLAGIDPESKSPRRNLARARDIPPEATPLIELLVEERLLSTDTKPEVDPSSGAEVRIKTIEPAHEALLRQWGLLQGWLAEDFGLLAALEAVNRAARDWDANARAPAWLAHQGQRLADAQALDTRPDIAAKLDAVDRRYLAASRAREDAAHAEAEARRQEKEADEARKLEDAEAIAAANKRIATRTRIGLVAALVLALVAGLFGFYAQRQRTVARTAESLAEQHANEAKRDLSGALAALSQVAVQTSPSRAAKLALASWPRDREDKNTPQLDVALTALGDATLQLRERRIFRGHEGSVNSAAFSPQGTRLLTASSDATARLWDTATGRQIAVLRGHEDQIVRAAFSPDGNHAITASWDKTARLWDTGTGKQITVLRGHEDKVTSAAFSPDGTRVVTASYDKTARLWDTATGKPIAVLRGHADIVSHAAFSPDGTRVVTASNDQTARLWDATTGKEIVALKGHRGAVFSAAFSPDGTRVVTGSEDGTPGLWDAATGKEIAVLRGHQGAVLRVAFSPDGIRVVTASDDKTARLWNAATGKETAVLRGHEDRVISASFSPDGTRIITASSDKTARLWDAATGVPVAVLRGHEGWIISTAFSPDGARVVTASWDMTARLWDTAIGAPVAVLRGHDGWVTSAAFSPDGSRVVTASDDKTARLWNAATGKEINVLRGHAETIVSAAFSPDGKRVVTASRDTTARLWDTATGKPIAVLRGHAETVGNAAFSPDGTRVVTASNDQTARLWDATTGKEIVVLRGHRAAVLRAAFSPDGTRVVTASEDDTAGLWDAATGKKIAVFRGAEAVVKNGVLSSDGTRAVAASDDNAARLWNAATGKSIAVLRGHEGRVMSAAFSPDGARVVTASDDKTARLWDAATGKAVAILRGHEGEVVSAVFSPDGTRVVTASSDNTARVWDVSTIPKGDLFQIACKWLPDTDLTDIAKEYGLPNLAPICRGDPPLPEHLPQ